MEIDYQSVINAFGQIIVLALPLGITYGFLEKLVIFVLDAALDRFHKRSD